MDAVHITGSLLARMNDDRTSRSFWTCGCENGLRRRHRRHRRRRILYSRTRAPDHVWSTMYDSMTVIMESNFVSVEFAETSVIREESVSLFVWPSDMCGLSEKDAALSLLHLGAWAISYSRCDHIIMKGERITIFFFIFFFFHYDAARILSRGESV